MINIGEARARLADILTAANPGVTVIRAGIDTIPEFPVIIIGQPDWTEAALTLSRFERSTFPVAVVVRRSGSDSADVDQLDSLWPAVVETLAAATITDPTLGGVCDASRVTRARFGTFTIQGTSYPAQLITADLFG